MELVRLLPIALLSLSLLGCSSSSTSTTPPSESPSENNTTGDTGNTDTPSDTDMSSTDETDTANNTSGEAPAGILPGEPNPGSVPDPVLAELTDVTIVNFGGHKVYAGPEQDPASPDYAYFNIDFDCGGTGSFEGFPRANDLGLSFALAQGSITWAVDESLSERVTVTVTDIVDNPGVVPFDADEIRIKNDFASSGIIVGESSIRALFISRIVQYKECP